MAHTFTPKQIEDMAKIVSTIVDDFLIDLYGDLPSADGHTFTRKRVELLMRSAYHAGYETANCSKCEKIKNLKVGNSTQKDCR